MSTDQPDKSAPAPRRSGESEPGPPAPEPIAPETDPEPAADAEPTPDPSPAAPDPTPEPVTPDPTPGPVTPEPVPVPEPAPAPGPDPSPDPIVPEPPPAPVAADPNHPMTGWPGATLDVPAVPPRLARPEPAAPPPVPPRRAWPLRIACLLLAAATVAMTGLWWLERSDATDLRERRDAALAAARRLATNLTTYDYRQIAADVKRVSDDSTGTFKKDYTLASGETFQKLVQENQAVAKGEVKSAGIVEITDDHVLVLLAVDQDVTNSNTPAGRKDRNRIQLRLVVEDGRWLVEDVTVV